MSRATLALALCTGFVTGCFDVHQADDSGTLLTWPTEHTVDDAERADGFPTWSLLDYWTCAGFGGPSTVTCGTVAPGYDDQGSARFLAFDVAPNSADDYPSAGLLASGIIEADLSPYDELVFSASVAQNPAFPWPDDVELRFQLNCPAIDPTHPAPDGEPVSVQSAVVANPGAGWQSFSLAIAAFIQPSWQTWARIDPADCLRHVASIGFVEATTVPDQRLAGTLVVDDVELYSFSNGRPRAGSKPRLSPWSCYDLDGHPSPICDLAAPDPTVTLAPGPGEGGDVVGQSLCAGVTGVDDASELTDTELDVSGFENLAVSATFAPLDPARPTGARFDLRLGCFDAKSVVRSFDVSPGLATYRLPIASFVRDYTIQQLDAACIAHVNSICIETERPVPGVVQGTLSVQELVLR